MELEAYTHDVRPDVLLLNETKLCGKPAPRLSDMYCVAVRDRTTGRLGGGGVAIYARKGLVCSDISPDADDITAVEVTTATHKLAVVSYYRPPDDNLVVNTTVLEHFVRQYDHCMIVGDMNAKHQYFGCTRTNLAGEQLFSFTEQHDLIVANDPAEATRHVVSTGCAELLDLVVVSKSLSGKLVDCYVGEDVGSDHLPVHVKLQLNCNVKLCPQRTVRPLNKCNWQQFHDVINGAVSAIGTEELQSVQDIDARCDVIRDVITSALDTACPVVTVRAGAFRVSAATLRLIREKRKLRRACQKHSDNTTLRTVYNNLSRQVAAAIRAEKRRAWETATASLNDQQGAKLWRTFKQLTGQGHTRSRPVRLMKNDGSLTSGDAEAAEQFAAHLHSVHVPHEGAEFDKQFEESVVEAISGDPDLTTASFPPHSEPDDNSLLVRPISVAEVYAALQKCKANSAPGADAIKYAVLKRVPPSLLRIIAHLYNTCLQCGYFPVAWKTAVGCMIAKEGKDVKLATSYRPISLLSTLGKLFERTITARLQSYLEDDQFFNKLQRAYLHKKEAAEHCYRLTETIGLAQQKGWTCTALSLDVEKAFDSVWHDGIRYKLMQIGLPRKLIRLISSFLNDRTISVRVGHTLSPPVPLRAGTPQGSVLSPLLYLIYVNDLPVQTNVHTDAAQFADDVSAWTLGSSRTATYKRLQRVLLDVERWCAKWRVRLNVNKTQLVSFASRKQAVHKLKLFNTELSEQNELKILGVTVNSAGSLQNHCKEKAANASRRVALLRSLRGQAWGASTKTLLRFYKQYVRPVLETGSVCTAVASKSYVTLLQTVQNAALRTCLRAPYGTRIADLHTAAGVQPVAERLQLLRDRAVQRFGRSELMTELETRRLVFSRQ
jgi:exonuclease III